MNFNNQLKFQNSGEVPNNNGVNMLKHLNSETKPIFKLKIDKSVFVIEQKGQIKTRYRIQETLGKGSYGEVKKI